MKLKRYNVIDLFAGAGGLSYGFEMTGKFDVIAACEKNENAKATYLRNHDRNRFFKDDVAEIEYIDVLKAINNIKENEGSRMYTIEEFDSLARRGEAVKIDIIIGGPPCQGFSNANRQKNHLISSNNEFVKEYIRIIKEIKPEAFVMENVKMFSSPKHKFFRSDNNIEEFMALENDGKVHNETFHIDSLPVFADRLYDDIFGRTRFESCLLTKHAYSTLNVLYKARNDNRKLKSELERKAKDIAGAICDMEKWLLNAPENIYGEEIKRQINQFIQIKCELGDSLIKVLESLVITQRLFNKLEELVEHSIQIDNIEVEENNVIIHTQSVPVLDYVLYGLNEDYTIGMDVLKAVEFGIPQIRERFIMIGIRRDILNEESLDMPKGSFDRYVTVDQAICDLANVEPYKNVTSEAVATNGLRNTYLDIMHSQAGIVYNHINTETREVAQERYDVLKEGENLNALGDEYKSTYAQTDSTQSSIYLKLDRNKPSNTVTNVRKSMWVSPYAPRAISIREAARLQSFDDDFIFVGTKDSQYQQVGNAVPPLLAKHIGEHLYKKLEEAKKPKPLRK